MSPRIGGATRHDQTGAPGGGFRGLLLPGAVALAALAILLALGTWQLQRRAWKESLLAQIAARAHGEAAEVLPEAAWPDWRASEDEFRRVRLAGTFLHDREALVHGLLAVQRGAPAQGFYLFTPLRLEDGAHVLVNRGFVPTELADPALRAVSRAEGRVTVTGLVRAPEARGFFAPADEPARNRWFTRDVAGIAAAKGLERFAPYYVDAEAAPSQEGWPRPGATNLRLPNNHFSYAITWFGIAAALVGVFAAFAWRRIRPFTP